MLSKRIFAAVAAVTMLALFGCNTAPPEPRPLPVNSSEWTASEWDAFVRFVQQSGYDQMAGRANEGDVDAINWEISRLWPNPNDAAQMRYIVNRESRYQPWAKNPRSSASGLTQQLDIHAWRYERRGWDWNTDRFDAFKNLAIARDLYDAAGFSPWRCC